MRTHAQETTASHVELFTSFIRATSKAALLLFSVAVLLAGSTVAARGQSALDGFDPNANGTVRVIVVQPDGKILLGGDFTTLSPNGGAAVTRNRIARLNADGTLDTAFNPNANASVRSIAVQADGKILVGGSFNGANSIGGQTRNYIARLDATTGLADSFDPNANNYVYAVAVQTDGKILAGGDFTTLAPNGGAAVTRNRIARLDATGSADSFDPNANATIRSIAVQTDGKILAGGQFASIGGQTRHRIARLDPTTGLADSFDPNGNSDVYAIALQADGKILAGGFFLNIGGQTRNYIARLDPTTGLADSFNPNANFDVLSIAVQADGKILAGGFFTSIGGQTRNHIARLDAATGSADSFDPNANGDVLSIAVQADGKVLAGGSFTTLAPNGGGAVAHNFIAGLETDGRLDQTLNLSAVGTSVTATAVQPDGKVLIGGNFTTVLGVARNNIARLNTDGTLDTTFNPNASGFVFSIAVQADGKILAAGLFTSIGGQTRNYIARLDPVSGLADSWNPNANNDVLAIAVQADGKILAGGNFASVGGQTRNQIARLDAVTGLADSWNPNANSTVVSIALQPDGKILAGGFFTSIGGQTRNYIARLDPNTGLSDSFNPNANNAVYSIAVQVDGKILAGGLFFGANGIGGQTRNSIARVDATTGLADSFNPNANSAVYSIAVQADGKILAGGAFDSIGGQSRHIARLDPMTGLADSFNPNANNFVYSIAVQAEGKILAGGLFSSIGGQPRSFFARLSNDTAALQNLAVTQTTITWTRGGSSPPFTRVTFEYSTDDVNYTPLGNGTPVGSSWTRTGLNLSTGLNIYIRGRGYYPSGRFNGSESISESVRNAFLAGTTQAPVITSANNTTFTVGSNGNFTVTATGSPTPTLSESGALPSGVTFIPATGVLSGTPAAGTGGTYPITFTASNGVGSPAIQSFTLTVNQAPAITSANNTAFTVGSNGGFPVTATGSPPPTLSESGALPSGVTFTPATGVLSGTPAAGTAGTYPITFTASNGVGSPAIQSFTLTVIQAPQAPAITSANSTTFALGSNGNFTVTATGFPTPTLSESGALPSGVTFTPATGALGGTPAVGTGGTYLITFTASNGVGSDAIQSFTLTVNQAPAFTSAGGTTFTVGSSNNFNVTATGFPTPTLSESGALPSGVTFTPATGVLSGTPAAGTAGTYPITFTASNGVGSPAMQSFTLAVNQAPAITSSSGTTFTVGSNNSFTVTATGVPPPTLSESGFLPSGVTFAPATGVLSGTPAAGTIGSYPISFKASNGVGSTVEQNFTLTVGLPPGSALDGFDPNADGAIRVVVVQPNGKILLGGDFTTLAPNGGVAVTRNHIARLNTDGTVDTAFDPNANGIVRSIALQSDGKILVGGDFFGANSIGGATRNFIARLDSATGAPDSFDPNANNTIDAIAVQADGKILAGGGFTNIGGRPRNRMARLNAATGLADSFDPSANNDVLSIVVQADGRILTGGAFVSIGGMMRNHIARLDAATGSADSFNPSANNDVNSIAVQVDGKILAGGLFTNIAGQPRSYIARLDAAMGSADSFNPSANNVVEAIALEADGKILVGGIFNGPNSIGGAARNHIARLDAATGLADSFDPNANSDVLAIAVQADRKILAGGAFITLAPNGGPALTRNRIARLEIDGRLDRTLDLSADGTIILATAVQPDGKILIGGDFTSVLGVPRNKIARLNTDGTLDMAFDPNSQARVFGIAVQADGKVLVCGEFYLSIGGQPRQFIARLDAVTGLADSWNPAADGTVQSLAVQADGKIIAAGLFNNIGGQARRSIARLDAVTGLADSWNANSNGTVHSIAVQTDGKIVAGGDFHGANCIGGQTHNFIARLDAVTGAADSWDANSDSTVYTIAVQSDGKILAGGAFVNIGGQMRNFIARLDPVTGLADSFNPVSASTFSDVYSIATQADGKILAGGSFSGANSIGGQTRNRVVRLDAVTGLVDSFDPNANNAVYSIAVLPDGKVLAGGLFTNIGGQPRNTFARLTNGAAALQNLDVTPTTITWTRGGSSPQFARVIFESSTDHVTYTPLGNGTASGSNWTLTGLNLPNSQTLSVRARGYYRTGYQNGSESIQEFVRNAFTTTTALELTGAVSRKTHGAAGTFDIPLPLTGEPGVECRSSGGVHTLLFTFSNNVVSGNASVASGTGSISGSPTFAGNTMTVNVTGVTDVQKITVRLSGVTDSLAQVLPDTSVSANMLIGDVNGSKIVNTTDIGQVKALSGATVNAANFKADVAVSGTINTSDIGLVKSRSGQSLP